MDRPQAESQGLSWDFQQGRAYAAMLETESWKHLVGQMYMLRDEAQKTMLHGDEHLEKARATINLIDALLTIPVMMVDTGKYSEQELKRIAAERNFDG